MAAHPVCGHRVAAWWQRRPRRGLERRELSRGVAKVASSATSTTYPAATEPSRASPPPPQLVAADVRAPASRLTGRCDSMPLPFSNGEDFRSSVWWGARTGGGCVRPTCLRPSATRWTESAGALSIFAGAGFHVSPVHPLSTPPVICACDRVVCHSRMWPQRSAHISHIICDYRRDLCDPPPAAAAKALPAKIGRPQWS